jgi:hypothetical protein
MSTSARWLLALGVIILLFSLGSGGGGAATGALLLAAAVYAQARANQRTTERLAALETWVHDHWAHVSAAARVAQKEEKPTAANPADVKPAAARAATPQIVVKAPQVPAAPAPVTSMPVVPPKPAAPVTPHVAPRVASLPRSVAPRAAAPTPPVPPRVAPEIAPLPPPVASRVDPQSPPVAPAVIEDRRPEPIIAQPAVAAATLQPAVVRPQSRPSPPPSAPRRSLLDFEQILGVNWLSKIGVGILVIGVAFFLAWQLRQLGPLGKDVVGMLVGGALLAAGIWGERKERYQVLSRAAIAGGWSLLFFISYAAHHVDAARVVRSPAVALLLMFAVASGMVAHTLRYRSQVVTGLAFVLAFVTIALNRADVTSLSANLVLAAGFTFVVLRMRWYGLEWAGIAATYLNHYLWLRPLVEPADGNLRPLASFGTSAAILILYWAIFRVSFVVRRPPDERASVVAGILNTALLLAVMRYHSADPVLAFRLLLVLGVAELALARLPRMRERRNSFVALTAAGAALVTAAIPFRFAPGDVTPIWLLDALLFTTVGVVIGERVYRRLGTLLLVATSVQLLTGPATNLFAVGGGTDWFVGILALLTGVALYADGIWLPRRWPSVFDHGADRLGARLSSYLGVGMAMFAAWAASPGNATTLSWAALAVLLAFLERRISNDPDVPVHVAVMAFAAVWSAVNMVLPANSSTSAASAEWASRAATTPVVAILLFVLARLNASRSGIAQSATHLGALWAATGLLVALAWRELDVLAVGLVWAAMAVVLSYVGRRFTILHLSLQANVVALLVAMRVLIVHLPAGDFFIERPWPVTWRIVATLTAASLFYALSRWNRATTLASRWEYVRGPLWVGTALIVLVSAFELRSIAVSFGWVVLALALAIAGRRLAQSHLLLQSNVVLAMVVGRIVIVNLTAGEAAISAPFPVSWRLVTIIAAAAVLYTLSWWNRGGALTSARAFTVAPMWVATALLVLVPAFELRSIAVSFGWIVLALTLAVAGRSLAQPHFLLQSNIVLAIAVGRLVIVNLTTGEGAVTEPVGLSWRMVTIIAAAAVLYTLSWWNRGSALTSARAFAVAPKWMGTALLVTLAWFEFLSPAVVLAWTVIAFAIATIGRRFDRPHLVAQANVIAIISILRILNVNLPSDAIVMGGLSWRLLTVSPVAVLAYTLGRWNEVIAGGAAEGRGKRLVLSAPAWAGTGALVLLAWYQLLPASVAVAWTFLAVILLEIGIRRSSFSLLLQAYALVFASVARLFVVNINIDTGPGFGPRIYTIVPIIVAVLHVYRRLDVLGESRATRWLQPAFAWLAAFGVAALLRFELAADAVAPAWAAGAVLAAAAGALTGRRVFVHISVGAAFAALARAGIHNLYERSYFPSLHEYDRWLYVGATGLLLLASLPFAFRARSAGADAAGGSLLRRALRSIDARPEQYLFFIPLALITALAATETSRGLLTLALGIEAFTVFVFAVSVGERSFRFAGMGLLLVCVAKIFILDFWSLSLRDKSLTGIVLGLALIGVSLLYTRKRETILRYL